MNLQEKCMPIGKTLISSFSFTEPLTTSYELFIRGAVGAMWPSDTCRSYGQSLILYNHIIKHPN